MTINLSCICVLTSMKPGNFILPTLSEYCLQCGNFGFEGCGITFSRFLNRFSRSKTLEKISTKQRIVSLIDYDMLEKGTSGFKESNILGQGGFGCVYSATLENNIQAAVKKLDCANEEAAKEFKVCNTIFLFIETFHCL